MFQVTNNLGKDYILPNRLVIPDGETVILSDREIEWIPLSKRSASQLEISALTSGSSASGVYDTLIDEASASTSYVGEAAPDSLASDPVWRIKRIYESGTTTAIRYADGDKSFTKTWTARATYDYS